MTWFSRKTKFKPIWSCPYACGVVEQHYATACPRVIRIDYGMGCYGSYVTRVELKHYPVPYWKNGYPKTVCNCGGMAHDPNCGVFACR